MKTVTQLLPSSGTGGGCGVWSWQVDEQGLVPSLLAQGLKEKRPQETLPALRAFAVTS